MEEYREYDLSEGKFYSRWPDWTRWLLFIPAGIIGCLVVSTLFNIVVSLTTDASSSTLDHGWYNLISSVLLGAAFVGISAYVAPKKQHEISIIMLVIISIFFGMLWVREYDLGYFSETKDFLYYTMHFIAGILGAGAVTFGIKEELHKQR